MTTLTTPNPRARSDDPTPLPPLPWRRMSWVTWRQHRAALTGVTVMLGAIAGYLWLAGLQIHHSYAAVTACHPASSEACTEIITGFTGTYDHTATLVPALLQVLPALIGAFVGAPILAREFETGTFRYAWTQGFGRSRWALAKLVPVAVTLTLASGAFSLLFAWYYRPFIADGQSGPLTGIVFNLRGIAFAAWTLTAFAIGTFAGILVRRVVPAIVATLAAYAALAATTGLFLRRHYLTPLVTDSIHLPVSTWVMSQWWTKNHTFAFSGRPPIDIFQRYCPPSVIGPGKPSSQGIAACLAQHGYTQWTKYQPASRFWPFQWIESSWLLVLSVLLLTATIWLVHRRAA